MGNASSLEIVEEYAPGSGEKSKYFTNSVTEVELDEGAELKHGSVNTQLMHMAALHFFQLMSLLQRCKPKAVITTIHALPARD